MTETIIETKRDRVIVTHDTERVTKVTICGEGFYSPTLTRGIDFDPDYNEDPEA